MVGDPGLEIAMEVKDYQQGRVQLQFIYSIDLHETVKKNEAQ